jgi:tripartite-type tricarboxylate transporter receptor subunit TctC
MKGTSLAARVLRTLIAGVVAAAAFGTLAQDRTVRIVVAAPAGGTMDATARLLASRLSDLTGDHYVVDNRPGANSQIAAEAVVRSAPDGRVLMVAGSGLAFMPYLQKTTLSPLEDLAPVAMITQENFVLVANAASPLASARQLAEAAQRPGGVSCVASPGPPGIACEQLKARLGAGALAVPYPGVAPALAAVLGGHADVMFINVEAAGKLVAAGKLRVLAQTDHAGFAQVPTLSSLWPGFALDSHMGLLAPAGTPSATIRKLNADVNRVLADPQVVAALTRDGAQRPAGGTPQQYGAEMRAVRDRYGAIIERLGLGLAAQDRSPAAQKQ